MNQIENAFAPPDTRENHHPLPEDSKKGSEILGEIKESLNIAAGGGDGSSKHQNADGGESDKIANADAYANAQFEADYQAAKEKAREEMKEQTETPKKMIKTFLTDQSRDQMFKVYRAIVINMCVQYDMTTVVF